VHVYPLQRERVSRAAVAQIRPWYISPSRSRRIATTLHAIMWPFRLAVRKYSPISLSYSTWRWGFILYNFDKLLSLWICLCYFSYHNKQNLYLIFWNFLEIFIGKLHSTHPTLMPRLRNSYVDYERITNQSTVNLKYCLICPITSKKTQLLELRASKTLMTVFLIFWT
jgi:hypothetical protein